MRGIQICALFIKLNAIEERETRTQNFTDVNDLSRTTLALPYIALSNIVLGMKYLDPFAVLNKYYLIAHLAPRKRIKNVFIIIEMFRGHKACGIFAICANSSSFIRR